MPPQSASDPAFHLVVQRRPFYLTSLAPNESLPQDVLQRLAGPLRDDYFVSVTRTREEVSIVSDFPVDVGSGMSRPVTPHWSCIRVAGPMDLGLTGVLTDMTAPLKAAEIPIFAVSTYDTDWLLVPRVKLKEAVEALKNDGWVLRDDDLP